VLGRVVGPERQIAFGGEDFQLLKEAAYQLVVDDLLPGDLVHELAAVDTPNGTTAEAFLVAVDGLQDRDVVPADRHRRSPLPSREMCQTPSLQGQ